MSPRRPRLGPWTLGPSDFSSEDRQSVCPSAGRPCGNTGRLKEARMPLGCGPESRPIPSAGAEAERQYRDEPDRCRKRSQVCDRVIRFARLPTMRGSTSNRSHGREGVPYGPRRATKSDEDASGRPNRINGLRRVFKGADLAVAELVSCPQPGIDNHSLRKRAPPLPAQDLQWWRMN